MFGIGDIIYFGRTTGIIHYYRITAVNPNGTYDMEHIDGMTGNVYSSYYNYNLSDSDEYPSLYLGPLSYPLSIQP